MNHNLCPDCRLAQDKWIHMAPETARKIMRPGIRISSGAAYDDTAAGARDNHRHRADEFAALVRRQCELIADICDRKHRTSDRPA